MNELEFRKLLTETIDLQSRVKIGIPGFKYVSYEALILDKGRFYAPSHAPLPPYVYVGKPKECYYNAFTNMRDDLYYTEGYAVTEDLPLALQHAWMTTEEGIVIEPTWTYCKAVGYYGIAFTYEYVLEHAERTKKPGILVGDWENNFAILEYGLPDSAIIEQFVSQR